MLSAKLKCCVCLAKYSLFFFLLMCQFLLSYFYLFTSCSFGFYSVVGHFHLLVTCTCFYLFVSRFYTLLFIYQLFLLVSIRLPTVSACVCFTFQCLQELLAILSSLISGEVGCLEKNSKFQALLFPKGNQPKSALTKYSENLQQISPVHLHIFSEHLLI